MHDQGTEPSGGSTLKRWIAYERIAGHKTDRSAYLVVMAENEKQATHRMFMAITQRSSDVPAERERLERVEFEAPQELDPGDPRGEGVTALDWWVFRKLDQPDQSHGS